MILAVTAGCAAASLYYAQPVLPTIADDVGIGTKYSGTISTVSQIGFVGGILLVLPLGDIVRRRFLVPALLVITAVAQLVVALVSTTLLFVGGLFVMGVGACAAQVVVALAGQLAVDGRRNIAVATTVGGLVFGILAARAVSGVVADIVHWRAVFAGSAAILGCLAMIVYRVVPAEHRPEGQLGSRYRGALTAVARLALTDRHLLIIALSGAACFAAFNIYWTAAPFLLSGSPYGWSDAAIGLFGLLGMFGVISAMRVGRVLESRDARVLVIMAGLIAAIGFAWTIPGSRIVVFLIIGAILSEVGIQGFHATNQATVVNSYADRASAANAVYMSTYFFGGAAGSAVATTLYAAGWAACGLVCIGLTLAATILRLRRHPSRQSMTVDFVK
jgi:predicted MFS family arabinose efflux permease